MPNNLEKFQKYAELADELMASAPKEDIAECARLLALNVAHYQSKFGPLPGDEIVAMLSAQTLNEEQSGLLAIGMEVLVGMLGTVCLTDDEQRDLIEE